MGNTKEKSPQPGVQVRYVLENFFIYHPYIRRWYYLFEFSSQIPKIKKTFTFLSHKITIKMSRISSSKTFTLQLERQRRKNALFSMPTIACLFFVFFFFVFIFYPFFTPSFYSYTSSNILPSIR